MSHDALRPGIHGPSLRWYHLDGFLALTARSLWRFWVTGRPLRGKGDNASFLHDATVDYRGGPVEHLSRARWRRVAWRWGVAGVPLTLWAALGTWWALGYVLATIATLTTLGVCAFIAWWPVRIVRREFVVPVWAVVCRVIAEKPSKRAAIQSVILPPGFGLERDDESGEAPELVVRINLPLVPLDEGVRKRIAAVAGERLGIQDVQASWTVRGSRAFVDLQPRVLPPRSLKFAEVRNLVLAADPARPFVGLAAGRVPVTADLDNDGPHMGISGGTGTGKSTLLRLAFARRVRAGVRLVVCDYKVISHPWAKRISEIDPSRVQYLMDEEEIHEGIMRLFAEFQRRREILKRDMSALDSLPEIDLLIEELNTLAGMLRTWWGHEVRRLKVEAKVMDMTPEYLPVVCPSVLALAALVQMGREFKMHVHFAAQRLDASALSPKDGGAVRESITNRFLAKYTKQTWVMLCGGVPYQAFPGGPRGIWTAVVNGEVTFFRVPFMSNDEAFDLAMGSGVDAPVRVVTLREAVEAGTLPGKPSLDALRKRVQDQKTPSLGTRGNAGLYDMAALEALPARS